MKTCEKCGSVNSDTAKHCVKCGNLLPQQSNNMQSNFQSNDGNMGNMVRTKSNGLFRNAGAKLKILALVFFVIDILIGVALGVTCFIIGADSYEGYIFIIIGIAAILISPLIGWLNAIMNTHSGNFAKMSMTSAIKSGKVKNYNENDGGM